MIIIGAKGLAKQLLSSLQSIASEIFFYDDFDLSTDLLAGYRVLHNVESVQMAFQTDNRFLLGVGNPKLRSSLCSKFVGYGGVHIGLQSDRANISNQESNISATATILQGAVIESYTRIGIGTLINIGAAVCHGTVIGNFSEIGPNATIAGDCMIGSETTLGANCTLIPGITIGNQVVIGAGAVVINDLPSSCTAVGNPARILKR